MQRDLHNNLDVRRVLSPQVVANDAALVGQIISHAGFESIEYLIATGALDDANATFTVLLEHGDLANGGDLAPVADAQLLGTEALAGFQFDDDDEVRKLGYTGGKAYSRLTITPVGNGGNAYVAAMAVLGHAHHGPAGGTQTP